MESLIEQFDIEKSEIESMLKDSVGKAEDGEMFLEYRESEAFVFDNGKLKTGTFDNTNGFGIRAVSGDVAAYAHSGDMSKGGLQRACNAVRSIRTGSGGKFSDAPQGTNRKLYGEENPVLAPSFEEKGQNSWKISIPMREIWMNGSGRCPCRLREAGKSWRYCALMAGS